MMMMMMMMMTTLLPELSVPQLSPVCSRSPATTKRPKNKDRCRTMPPHSGLTCHILSVTPAPLNSSKGP